MNWDNIVKILQSLSIIAVSATAFFGINAWRKEFLGKKKIELAEEVIALFYKCKDNIKMIRNPFSSKNEGSSRKKDDDEPEYKSQIYDQAYVAIERYNTVKDDFNKVKSIKYRFITFFGKDKENLFIKLDLIIAKILTAAHVLGSIYWQNQGRVPMNELEFKQHLDEMHRNEAIFWDMEKPDDKINNEIDTLINQLIEDCSDILKIKKSKPKSKTH